MEYGMHQLGNDASHDNKQLLILNYFLFAPVKVQCNHEGKGHHHMQSFRNPGSSYLVMPPSSIGSLQVTAKWAERRKGGSQVWKWAYKTLSCVPLDRIQTHGPKLNAKETEECSLLYVQEENTLFWWTYGIVSNLCTYLCVCVHMFMHVCACSVVSDSLWPHGL